MNPTRQTEQTDIFAGPPIPASQLKRTKYIDPAHVEAINSIELGFARQTTLSRSSATSLIRRMESAKLVPQGRFRVRTFMEDGGMKVMIVHERPSEHREHVGSHTERLSVRSQTLDKHGIPPVEKLQRVIEDQPEYVHDMKTLSKLATGTVIDSHTKNVAYRALSVAAEEARKRIIQQHGGRFVEELNGRVKVYRWKADSK